MKRIVFVILVLLFLPTCMAVGQRINGRFVTSAYAWQRDDTIGVQHTQVLGYQTLQFDVYQKNVSLHANLQGFNSFGFNILSGPPVSSGPQV